MKRLKGIGFLILSLLIVYLSFPVWVGIVISSQLPKDVSLESYEINLPNWNYTFVENIKFNISNQTITIEGFEYNYQLNDIKIANVSIEETGQSSIDQTKAKVDNSLILRLPVLTHSDFEILEQFKKVSIEKITLKIQSQTINFLKVEFNKLKEGISRLSSAEVNIVGNSSSTVISKLSSILEVNSEQLNLRLYQTNLNTEQSLFSLSYQLTEQQLKLSAAINYPNLKALLPSDFVDVDMEPDDELKVDWLQNRLDNKLQITVSSLLKSSMQSIVGNEVFPAKLIISTDSEYYPLLANVKISLSSKNKVTLDSKSMFAKINPFMFNSDFNLNLTDQTTADENLFIDDINYELKLGTINFQNKDTTLILIVDQGSLIGTISDIKTSLESFEIGNLNLEGEVLLPSFSADYHSLTNDEEESSNFLGIKAEGKINFQVEKKENLTINGNFISNNMEVNHADGQLKSELKIEWNNIDLNLATGTANIIATSDGGSIAGLNYETAKLLSEVTFVDNEISGKGNLSVNEQLLTPYTFKYIKELADFSITLQKNQLANQLLNYFLKPFSKDSKVSLEITNGEVVHSASLELSDEMIVESIFNINDMSFNFGENNIYGLNLTQKLTSFSPIKLHSNISIESVNFSSGLEITNINMSVDSGTNDVFETTTFNGELFKGKLFSKAIKFNADGIDQSIIELKKISLTELVFYLEVAGLYADGNIDFSLPFSLKNGLIVIKDGNFKALDKGIIKYTYTDTDSGEEENIALKALKNFHYDSLDGTFSYNEKGLYHMKLHLLGSNPDLYDGYPVDFILNLRGELSGVFRSLFLTGNFEDAIVEQVKASNLEQ